MSARRVCLAAALAWNTLSTATVSDSAYRGLVSGPGFSRPGLVVVALQLGCLEPVAATWSYLAGTRFWLELDSCESSTVGPCTLPAQFDPLSANSTSHPTIEVVQNEDLTLSWHMIAGNASTRSFVQMFKTPCIGDQCPSGDNDGDSTGCTNTLAGRHSFIEDTCAGLSPENCITSELPCIWDAGDGKCGK